MLQVPLQFDSFLPEELREIVIETYQGLSKVQRTVELTGKLEGL